MMPLALANIGEEYMIRRVKESRVAISEEMARKIMI